MHSLPLEFRNRCEGIAVEQRRKLGLHPSDRLLGETLAAQYEAQIVLPFELAEREAIFTPEMAQTVTSGTGLSGFLLRIKETPYILVHPNLPPARRQSTLMHEMGHLLLGHKGESVAALLSGKRDKTQEAEAGYLGGCLQIPRIGLRWAEQRGLSVARIAEHFGASREMVTFRCRMTGIRL